jgi:signal transduction histidine kinase
MNPISAFFVRNIIVVFFIYGLAFFAMGLALALASRRSSTFRFARAIRPLAVFGILHGLHEWVEMFQKIATLTGGYMPTIPHEVVRLAILTTSFLMLLAFGILLLSPATIERRRVFLSLAAMVGLWLLSLLVITRALRPAPEVVTALADVLARYSLGVPGAFLGTWALMTQQRTFRKHGMPQFGRDLVWSASALFLYGAVGQIFVRQTPLTPSTIINSTLFLQWFGIPVQLFRGMMAAILAFYIVRALNAFELESQRRLEEANQARLTAQAAALESERRFGRTMEHLNEELRLTTHELSLLLDLSNLLAAPMSLADRLQRVLEQIVQRLKFPDMGLILLVGRDTGVLELRASIGFSLAGDPNRAEALSGQALRLGEQCVASAIALCRHSDGTIIEFSIEKALEQEECRQYQSRVEMISLPLTAQQPVIGSLVLGQIPVEKAEDLTFDELKLMLGTAQQLGLSIENARLYQLAQERETRLADLLHQAVGAQEAERQRIARELHDATAQSLTAIGLGLRGVETIVESQPRLAAGQIRELKSFSTNALGELRQIIADLRPSQLDDLGLVAAVQWYIQEFETRFAIPTAFTVEGSQGRLPAEYETVLFRITQEALANIAKHADASQATVRLEISPVQVRVQIIDNGRGFDPEKTLQVSKPPGWGLSGMQERALLLGGLCMIESKSGRGTEVRVTIPLTTETQNAENTAVVSG